jgi:hypothetical protein
MNCCDDFGKCTQGENCAARCTQDCNQGRNCTCAPKIQRMSDGQMGVLYFVMGILFLGVFVALEELLVKPTNAQDHADKYCQALYGPQTGAIWGEAMQCQTVRGEVLPARKP